MHAGPMSGLLRSCVTSQPDGGNNGMEPGTYSSTAANSVELGCCANGASQPSDGDVQLGAALRSCNKIRIISYFAAARWTGTNFRQA